MTITARAENSDETVTLCDLEDLLPVSNHLPCMIDAVGFAARTGKTIHPEILKFLPFGTRLVVMREEALKRTAGGIWIPPNAQDAPASGWVISCGQLVGTKAVGQWSSPYDAGSLLGMKVLFGKYSGSALLVGDSRETDYESHYVLLNEDAIWGLCL